jgi:hypothetical protein
MRLVLESFTILVFAAHLLAVNLAMAGPLWMVWLDWRSRRSFDEVAREAERTLARWSLVAFVLGVILGLALLGLVIAIGDRAYLAAARMIPPDRLWFGGGELLFYVALISLYLWLLGAAQPKRWLTRLLAVAAASNLLMHFPPLFAMLAALAHRPEHWGGTLERSLYHALLIDPEVLSRVLHIWLAALATGAVAVMLLVSPRPTAIGDTIDPTMRIPGDGRVTAAARWALAAMLAEFRVGLWTLAATPTATWGVAWTDDLAALLLLGAAIVGAFVLLQQLVGLAIAGGDLIAIRKLAITLAISTALMCAVAHYWRRLGEPPIANPADSGTDRASIITHG